MNLLKDILIEKKEFDTVALKCDKEIVTYRLLYKYVFEHVKRLTKQHNKSNIAIFLPNSIQYVVAYFSITFLNKVIIPIGVVSKSEEIRNTLEYCDVDLVITNTENIKLMRQSVNNFKWKMTIYNIDDNSFEKIGINDIENDNMYNQSVVEDNVALMMHTSGTTSNPKRVMLTHKNLISNAMSIIDSLELNKDSKTLIVLPLYLASANTSQLLPFLYLGASITIMKGMFITNKFYKIVQADKITTFTGVPALLEAILDFKSKDYYDISSLEKVCFGGGCIPINTIKKFMDRFPLIGFIQMYGQTEASTRITHLIPKDSRRKLGSIGKAIPGVEVRIIDPNGNDVCEGQIGELIIKGSNVMKGYYKNQEETQKVLKDGWLYSGDLGKFDQEQFIYLTGRKKNIIISGGINIYPEEIEEIIMNLPIVKEVCVIGREDKCFGEIPIAKVILYGEKRMELKNDIIKYCARYLSNYKIPADVIFVNIFEKTRAGKIKRRNNNE